MNNIMKKKFITYIGMCMLASTLTTGCLYEYPTETADGETGIDPTAVTLNAQLSLNLKMPSSVRGEDVLERPAAGKTPAYRHRFVVDVYENRAFVKRQIFYKDIADGREDISIPVSLDLHARKYEVAVWSDYAQVPNDEKEITGTEEYFYDTMSNHLLTALSISGRANNEYKDVFCGSAEVDFTSFRDQWGAEAGIEMILTRPVGRYQLVANDVNDFLKRIESGEIKGSEFTVRLKYTSYLNIGYNVLERLPRQGMMYMQYEKTINIDEMEAGKPLPLVFDYIFSQDEKVTRIPVSLEIISKEGSKENVVAATNFNVGVYAGFNSVTTYNFLTADPDGGIDFDPGYDGEVDIDVPGVIK